ncbi:MAG: galactokinase [Firmicutes bacterium]|nr:galactokinase [Bacillota bacterium]
MADTLRRAQLVREKLIELFGDADAERVEIVKAPGRVNLIGEHTDYNDGFVLPAAVDREIIMAASPRDDDEVHLYALDLDSRSSFSLSRIEPDEKATWSNYIRGVLLLLKERGLPVRGMNAVFSGDVPLGAGMSSSAALEMAAGVTAAVIGEFAVDMVELVKIAQAAENNFVGVNCGIMDQFISGLGKKGHALFLDCRSLDYELVPLPSNDEYKIVIANTMVKRGLVDSAYNERRSQCETGVEILKEYLPEIKALRDVSPADFAKYKDKLPPVVAKRCEHIVFENERVKESVKALQTGDVEEFGRLMRASHESLRDLYEVSCKELDIMVEAAWEAPGTCGARMTGAGFGGCTVNLVKAEAVDEFVDFVKASYAEKTGIDPEVYVCEAEDGAKRLEL